MNMYDCRKRALLFDSVIIAVIVAILTVGVPQIPIINNWNLPGILACMIALVLLIIKDVILKNGSIGKRVFNIHIVDKTTQDKPKISQLVLRNITLIIWPVEVYFLFYKHQERLGDKWANTEVVAIKIEK